MAKTKGFFMKTGNQMKTLALSLALSGLFVWQAGAILTYDYSFSTPAGPNQVVASGQLSGTLIGYNTVDITSGTFNMTVGPGSSPGVYSVLANPNAPNTTLSPSGFFQIDNLLLTASDPVVNVNGLLFTSGQTEINLWGLNSPGQYEIYLHDPNNNNNDFAVAGGGNFNLVPVPEASVFAVAGVAMLGLVYAGRVYSQRTKLA